MFLAVPNSLRVCAVADSWALCDLYSKWQPIDSTLASPLPAMV